MTYDGEHRLCRSWEPESGSEILAYDAAGNLAWSASGASYNGAGCGQDQVADNSKTTRTYDAMNRVTAIVYPTGTAPSTFSYDALGNIASSTTGTTPDDMVTWAYGRNRLGLLTAEVIEVNGWSWGLSYDYDANGALKSVGYPSGELVFYSPDALGRPSQVGEYASGVTYFPSGDVKSYDLGSGTYFSAEQNFRLLPSLFKYRAGETTTLGETFAYDGNGNVTEIGDLVPGKQRSKVMEYDGLNRLKSARADNLWGTESYAYDTLNNIRGLTNANGPSTYHYDGSNLLSSITNNGSTVHAFQYDARGNTIGKDGQVLDFDLANRLKGIQGKGTYVYDAAGRRVKKVTPSGTTFYAYNNAGQLMWEVDPATRLGSSYVYLGKRLIAKSTENVDILHPGQAASALTILGLPQRSANGATIDVTLDIANTGSRPFVSTGQYRVQMGYHLVDEAGMATQVEGGVDLPADIAPGAHGTMIMHVRAADVLGTGKRIRFSLVQVAVGWLEDWPNNSVSIAGPYSACPTAGTGNLCNNVTGLNGDQVGVVLTMTAAPTLTADGQNVLTTVDIANTGKVTLASVEPHPVNLGNHIIDAAGNAVQVDLTRKEIPEIAPGQHAAITISTPASSLLGSNRRVQFEPVQEGVAWFQSFGITPLIAGPYATLGGAASSANGGFTLTWQAIGGAASYTLRESFNNGAWATVSSSNATSWSVSGRATGSYAYQIQACASGGCAPFGPSWSVNVLLPPPVPASASALAPIPGPVTLAWSASATAARYVVIQQFNGGPWSTVYDGAATSVTLGTPSSGTYQYQVQACNSSGCSGYRLSNAVGITVPPSAAPGIAGSGTSTNGAFTISWGGVAGATSYYVTENVNGGGWNVIASTAGGSWGLSGKPNGTYRYAVQACNAGGCGSWSSEAVVTVALPPVTPSGVSAVRLAPNTKRRYQVTWNASPTTVTYELERTIPDVGTDYQTTPGAGTLSFTFVEDTYAIGQYSMRLRACNASGCSAWSGYVYVSF